MTRADTSHRFTWLLPSHLALNADHRAIGGPHVSFSVQRYSDEKCPRLLASNNLNAGDGLTPGQRSDGRKALFPESPVVRADFIESKHAAGPLRARVVSKNACTATRRDPEVAVCARASRNLIPIRNLIPEEPEFNSF